MVDDPIEYPPDRLRLAYRLTNLRRHCPLRCAGTAAPIAQKRKPIASYELEAVTAEKLQAGDTLLVEEGQYIHADGIIVGGMAMIDEAAVTGRSTHVLREVDGVSEVMRDSLVVNGRILVQVTTHPRSSAGLDHRTYRADMPSTPWPVYPTSANI